VWLVYDHEWEEIGTCPDGEVLDLDVADAAGEIAVDGAELAIRCGDGGEWSWSDAVGWLPRATATALAVDGAPTPSSWWPSLELTVRAQHDAPAPPAYEGWVRLRWNL